MIEVNKKIAENHGLTEDEYEKIIKIIGKKPNFTELGIFSAMWNEHCSYKSSKKWLKTLPTKNERVIQGPGENAGVIDIDDDDVAIFKIESHNHPSFIEPYQGAATGVGGILRDIFTMGARPVASLNSLRFGSADHPKTKYLLNGVVSGIAGYGNCIGVPTVGGEIEFDSCYNGNILVNAMNIGITKKNKVFYSIASGVGNPVIYVGSKTGRDGIHGASMASQEFDENTEAKKPTVQVGDPFSEKLLLEACLELMKTNAIVSIQDMGAAGLTSSSVEMASKGKVGIEINLDKVPCREKGMSPYEIMLSESQERMLIVLKEGKEKDCEKIFNKWGLDFSIIGKLTNTNKLILLSNNEVVCDLAISALSDQAPEYDRKWEKPITEKKIDYESKIKNFQIAELIEKIISHPNQTNKSWVWEQYDHMVMCDTINQPGGNASIIRVHNTNKAIAATVDCTPRYCKSSPFLGGMQAVCETYRNLCSVGATPIAITNCLNFGNPEKPEIMGQFIDVIKGIAEACKKLNYPVISGNVSLYNETNGIGINPTPVIGGVGLIKNINQTSNHKFKEAGNLVYIIGETVGHLGQSILCYDILNLKKGEPPPLELEKEIKNGKFIIEAIKQNLIQSSHDVSSGGIILSILEMCIPSKIGINLNIDKFDFQLVKYLFGEDQSRYVIEVKPENEAALLKNMKNRAVSYEKIGKTINEKYIHINHKYKLDLNNLIELHNKWFKNYNK